MKMWVKPKHEFYYWDINKNVLVQEKKINIFYTELPDPICAYFFQEFYIITKNKQTKTLCLYHIFPVMYFYSSSQFHS